MIEATPVVILAGGQGSRIGGHKPERQLAGMSLLNHAIAKGTCYSPLVAISVEAGTQSPSGSHAMIYDEGNIQGPIAGLIAAFKFASAANAEHVMIVPCDTPFLPEDLLLRLHTGIGKAKAAVAQCSGQVHPACSMWRVDAASLLFDYVAQGRRSLIGFAKVADYIPVDWPKSSADLFFNINTVDDLARAEEIKSAFPPLRQGGGTD